MNEPWETAFPIPGRGVTPVKLGLSVFEYALISVASGLASNPCMQGMPPEHFGKLAYELTGSLLEQAAKGPPDTKK